MKSHTHRVLSAVGIGAFSLSALAASVFVAPAGSTAFAYGPVPPTTTPTTTPPTTTPTTTPPTTTPTTAPTTTTPPTTAPAVAPPPVSPPAPPSGLAFTGIDAALITAVGAGAVGAGGAIVLATRKKRRPSQA
ncbi:MAG: hypothetical protein ACP5P1_05665 [Acidimicrobiales bacterium]